MWRKTEQKSNNENENNVEEVLGRGERKCRKKNIRV